MSHLDHLSQSLLLPWVGWGRATGIPRLKLLAQKTQTGEPRAQALTPDSPRESRPETLPVTGTREPQGKPPLGTWGPPTAATASAPGARAQTAGLESCAPARARARARWASGRGDEGRCPRRAQGQTVMPRPGWSALRAPPWRRLPLPRPPVRLRAVSSRERGAASPARPWGVG